MADIVQEIANHSGHTARMVVRCARKGKITKCRLVQWDDDEALYDGFRYSFWSAQEACPSPMLVANGDPRLPDHDWDRVQFQIGEPREVEKGQHELLKDGKPDTKVEWDYRNRDNGGSQTNMLRQIYLELVDLGPKDERRDKVYKLFLSIEPKTD